MDTRLEQTSFERRYTNDQEAHEKILSITSHLGNANQNHNDVHFTLSGGGGSGGLVAKLCPTCDLMDSSPPDSSVDGILQALSRMAIIKPTYTHTEKKNQYEQESGQSVTLVHGW